MGIKKSKLSKNCLKNFKKIFKTFLLVYICIKGVAEIKLLF